MITVGHLTLLLLVLLLLTCASSRLQTTVSPHLPDRYIIRTRGSREPLEYVDPIYPPLLPNATVSCSTVLLQHDFAYTYGSPPTTAIFKPPGDDSICGNWTRAILDLSVFCAGEQYDRIAGVWIDGVELLRTSTAEPSESGIFWKVRKDVSKYSSVLQRICRYLSGTLFAAVQILGVFDLQLCGFSNIDWAGDTSDWRSHGGHLIFLSENLISWKSGKYSIMSRSSTVAEHRSLADIAAELNWTISMIKEMGITLKLPL